MLKFSDYRCPVKLRQFYKEFRDQEFNMLDVGCGNHVVNIMKTWFPQVHYYGIDREVYNNSPEDFAQMEKFYVLDLNTSDLKEIPDDFFDLINLSHVIEHLENGFEVLQKLLPKLKKNGKIYIEFPSERSLGLPTARGTLHFCDDPTHVYVHSIRELSNFLIKKGVRVIKAGRPKDHFRWLMALLLSPYQLYSHLKHGKMTVKWSLWVLLGFADYVYAIKEK